MDTGSAAHRAACARRTAQHPGKGEGDDIGVAQASGSLGDIQDVVPDRPPKCDQGRCDTFVSEPAHILAVDDVFVGQIVGGESLRCQDIFGIKPGVICKDCFDRHAGAKLAQNQFHRNTRAANDWFAVHDIRVRLDAFVEHAHI